MLTRQNASTIITEEILAITFGKRLRIYTVIKSKL